jgi:hypothetical protein
MQPMSKTHILDPKKSYTFSKYAEMPFATEDILAEFGVGFKSMALQLPSFSPISSNALKAELEENMALVDPTSEIARRESMIFPVLKTVCKFSQTQFKIEYPVRVSNWLRGSFDYFLPFAKNLVVIEAKNADIARGFTQLAVELIALDQWTESDTAIFYGCVTTGDTWKFGTFDRVDRIIHKDINSYWVPGDIDRLLSILLGIGAEPVT